MAFTTRPILAMARPTNVFVRSLSLLVPPDAPDTPERTTAEVVRELTETVIGGPEGYNPQKYKEQRRKLVDRVPSSQDELPRKRSPAN